MNKSEIWKFIAFGALGIYVFHQWKENPYALGSEEEIRAKAHRLIDSLSKRAELDHQLAGMIKSAANEAIKSRMNIRDVTP